MDANLNRSAHTPERDRAVLNAETFAMCIEKYMI